MANLKSFGFKFFKFLSSVSRSNFGVTSLKFGDLVKTSKITTCGKTTPLAEFTFVTVEARIARRRKNTASDNGADDESPPQEAR
jgi:hypothetical protein